MIQNLLSTSGQSQAMQRSVELNRYVDNFNHQIKAQNGVSTSPLAGNPLEGVQQYGGRHFRLPMVHKRVRTRYIRGNCYTRSVFTFILLTFFFVSDIFIGCDCCRFYIKSHKKIVNIRWTHFAGFTIFFSLCLIVGYIQNRRCEFVWRFTKKRVHTAINSIQFYCSHKLYVLALLGIGVAPTDS